MILAKNINRQDVPKAPPCPAIPKQGLGSSRESILAGPWKQSLRECIEQNDAERSKSLLDREGGSDASNRIVVIQKDTLLGRENDRIGWTTVL